MKTILINVNNVPDNKDSGLHKMMVSSNGTLLQPFIYQNDKCEMKQYACLLSSKQIPLAASHLSQKKLKYRQRLAKRK